MKIVPLCAVLVISLSNAVLGQPAQVQNVCLRQDMVRGWDVVNDKSLTDRVGKKFAVSLMPGCFDLKFNERLAFQAFGRTNLSCLGSNDYVLVPASGGQPRQRCFISDVQAYNAASAPGAASK
jgi:hypothetical protein